MAPELEGLDREKIKTWYNGYNWLGEHVYNPYDVLNLFKKRTFQNYWFETGTPTSLVKLLLERQILSLSLDSMHSSTSMLSGFDVDNMTSEALLFQTGYLTIKSTENLGDNVFYTLGYPNHGVYKSLIVEDCSNHGRLDMTLKFNGQVYLFEFKVVELAPEGKALQQLKDKRYADKYRALNQPVHLIGVEFSKQDCNIVGFEVAQ